MKTLTLTSVVLFALLAAGIHSAWGVQEKSEVKLTVVAQMETEVVNAEGQKEIQLVPAEKVVPGDVVIYTIKYTNNGRKAAENFVITNPVPQHMEYLTGSAKGESAKITFSVDGGNSYDIPGNLTVADSEGTRVAATSSDYTHIRWVLNDPVAPNETGLVTFMARLK